MKVATLYTLRAEEIVCGSHIALVRAGLRPTWTDDPKEYIGAEPEQFLLPVHTVYRAVKPTAPTMHVDPALCEVNDVFFAVEPALKEILEAPFVGEMRNAQAEAYLAYDAAGKSFTQLGDIRRRLEQFNLFPIWKRIWLAARGRCIA